MLSLKDTADMVALLHIVDIDHIWIGKLQDKVDKSIGIYPLKRSGRPRTPIGGKENTDHGTKQISMLIHWNKNVVETEKTAATFYDAISAISQLSVKLRRSQTAILIRMVPFIRPPQRHQGV